MKTLNHKGLHDASQFIANAKNTIAFSSCHEFFSLSTNKKPWGRFICRKGHGSSSQKALTPENVHHKTLTCMNTGKNKHSFTLVHKKKSVIIYLKQHAFMVHENMANTELGSCWLQLPVPLFHPMSCDSAHHPTVCFTYYICSSVTNGLELQQANIHVLF